jgi:hypothetical protein
MRALRSIMHANTAIQDGGTHFSTAAGYRFGTRAAVASFGRKSATTGAHLHQHVRRHASHPLLSSPMGRGIAFPSPLPPGYSLPYPRKRRVKELLSEDATRRSDRGV